MASKPDIATALNAPDSALDEEEKHFVGQIREEGWFHTAIFADGDGTGYSFTTGLWVNFGYPEVLVFSLRREVAHAVLQDIYTMVQAGSPPPISEITDKVFGNAEALLLPVAKTHYAAYLGWSRWFYGNDDFPCLQLFWPDKNGFFPGQVGADETLHSLQPVLAEPEKNSH